MIVAMIVVVFAVMFAVQWQMVKLQQYTKVLIAIILG
jgi:hypothetical protein